MKQIYLDNAATTRTRQEAVDAMLPYFTEAYGNPSAIYRFAAEGKKALDESRSVIAGILGAKPEEIYFTSGGTESDNWAIFKGAESMRRLGRHIVITGAEHDAIGKPAAVLESKGWEVTRVMPGKSGAELAAIVKEKIPGIKVILASGYSEEIAKRELSEQENFEFMAKPFSLGDLTAKVFDVLNKGKPQ